MCSVGWSIFSVRLGLLYLVCFDMVFHVVCDYVRQDVFDNWKTGYGTIADRVSHFGFLATMVVRPVLSHWRCLIRICHSWVKIR